MSGPSIAQQVAALKTCDATLRRLATLLAGLAAERESAGGATRLRRAVDWLRQGLVYEFPALAAEHALDQLLAADGGWHHPTQVLDAPIRDWALLLRFCDERMKGARGEERARCEEVRRKLARALRIEEQAAERRRQRRERDAEEARRRRRRELRGRS